MTGILSILSGGVVGPTTRLFNGIHPASVAVAPNRGTIYVASSASAIAVYDISVRLFVGWIPLSGAAGGMAYDPYSGMLFATEPGLNEVVLVNTSTNTVYRTAPVGSVPLGAAYDGATGDVYVTNAASANITILNGSTGASAGAILVSGAPLNIISIPATGYLYAFIAITNDVAVINATSKTVTSTITVGTSPTNGAYDPTNGNLYVANSGPANGTPSAANVSIVRLTTSSVVGWLNLGSALTTTGVAYNAYSNEVLVGSLYATAGYDQTQLLRVNTTTDSVTGGIAVGAGPTGIGYYAPLQEFVVANDFTNNVSVVSATSNTAAYSVRVGVVPAALTPAPGIAQLFINDNPGDTLEGSSVFAYNVSTQLIQATVRVGIQPIAAAYDASLGALYVSDEAEMTMTKVNALTDSVINTLLISGPLGGPAFPEGVVWDPTNESIVLVNNCTGPPPNCPPLPGLQMINTAFDGAVHAVGAAVDSPALGLLSDPATGRVYFAEPTQKNLFVASATNLSKVANVSVPASASELTLDPLNGRIYLLAPSTGTVVVFDPLNDSVVTTFAFTAAAGPTSVAFDPVDNAVLVSFSSGWVEGFDPATGAVTMNVSTGGSPGAIAFDPDSDSVYVADNARAAVDILTSATVPRYPATFMESGLPSGVEWNVTVSGRTTSSVLTSITVYLSNGSYTYSAWSPGFVATPPSGSLVVTGMPVSVSVAFSPGNGSFPVHFVETGLPFGTAWGVYINGTQWLSFNTTVELSLTFGRYPFTVLNVTGYVSNPSNGNVSVVGVPVTVSIAFVPESSLRYPLTFDANGLPAGLMWSIVINNVSRLNATVPSISINEPNGTYYFAVGAPADYSVSPSSGTVRVNGTAKSVTVDFFLSGPGRSGNGGGLFGLTVTETYALFTAVAAAAVVAGLALMKRQRPRRPEAVLVSPEEMYSGTAPVPELDEDQRPPALE